MSSRRWANVSYLDVLRPDHGWATELALLASYSADLTVLVAALLALAGVDDDRGSGNKVDLANAIDRLGGRARLVVQAGRLVAPSRAPRILGVLDRYVREVSDDEAVASWHPKVALVKHVASAGGEVQWRLWVGSRNLSHDLSWDVGLALIGRTSGAGVEVAGVPELAAELAERAALTRVTPAQLRSELRKVRWAAPKGCTLRGVHLLGGDHARALPPAPRDLRRLIVVSPFLDGGVVGELGRWGDERTRRTLVSTRSELSKLAAQAGEPLAGFRELLYLAAPEALGVEGGDPIEANPDAPQDEEPDRRGLHAKIIFADGAAGRTMWVGSANATRRGWYGPNAEVVAEMGIRAEAAAGLLGFVEELATPVRLEELGPPVDSDPALERLEDARKAVVRKWEVRQERAGDLPVLIGATDPNPPDASVSLEVGLLGGAGATWPRGVTSVRLPVADTSHVTELIWCRLRLDEAEVSWLQRAPLDPPPGDERDQAAMARFLGPRTFLSWLRALLTGEAADDGGGDWDHDPSTSASPARPAAGPTWWAPTLEEVLGAWSRDAAGLLAVDAKVRHYLKHFDEQADATHPRDERRIVEEFRVTWEVLRRELFGGPT